MRNPIRPGTGLDCAAPFLRLLALFAAIGNDRCWPATAGLALADRPDWRLADIRPYADFPKTEEWLHKTLKEILKAGQ